MGACGQHRFLNLRFFLCYLWDRKKCKLISDERCQGLDTNSFHFTFYVSCVFREKKKTKYRKKQIRVLSTEYSVGGAGAVRAPPGAQKTGRRGVSCRGRRKHRKHPKSRKKRFRYITFYGFWVFPVFPAPPTENTRPACFLSPGGSERRPGLFCVPRGVPELIPLPHTPLESFDAS